MLKLLRKPASSKVLSRIWTLPLLFQLCRKAEPPVPVKGLNPPYPLIVTVTSSRVRLAVTGEVAENEVNDM